MQREVWDFDRESLHNFGRKGNEHFACGILIQETLEVAFKYGSVEKHNFARIWKAK